jgi:hypothetical protein
VDKETREEGTTERVARMNGDEEDELPRRRPLTVDYNRVWITKEDYHILLRLQLSIWGDTLHRYDLGEIGGNRPKKPPLAKIIAQVLAKGYESFALPPQNSNPDIRKRQLEETIDAFNRW